jgi:hypothetical protein
VKDLAGLEKLHGLTQLTLNLSDSQVQDLAALTKLSKLQQLMLAVTSTKRFFRSLM